MRDPRPQLPEDIWCHIHSLMSMQDSARAACVSRTFLRSWRFYPCLILTMETLGFKRNTCEGDIDAFTDKVDQIMRNHSGAAVKTLEIDILDCCNLDPCFLSNWLRIGITRGTENVTLRLPVKYKEEYSFPCTFLFGGTGSSIRHLHLAHCALRPTDHLGCLRNLTKLYLCDVRITGEELGCLLSRSLAVTDLELRLCSEIICLKIPCVLEQLSRLTVCECSMLQMIENKAPNLSTIRLQGDMVQLSLGQPFQVKYLCMGCTIEPNFLSYAITKLPYIVPNVDYLTLYSMNEMIKAPVLASKFLHLKYMDIYLDGSPGYDYLSLVSFFDSSPVLEAFSLFVYMGGMILDPVFQDDTHMRQMPGHKHDSLKDVTIFGFCSSKSMVELTCHILDNATSLGSITLDSIFDDEDIDDIGRCCLNPARKAGACRNLSNGMILEANTALLAIERYILGKVPSTVKLEVRRPCSWCHSLERRRQQLV